MKCPLERDKIAKIVPFKGRFVCGVWKFCYICSMIDQSLINFMQQELRQTPTGFHRYMWDNILWTQRMVGLTGPRGVGKSTMVKQYMLSQGKPEEWLYVSADHSYFANHSLSELAEEFMREGGKHLVIDEVHKYSGWSRELKEIYDGNSEMQVIFTGSSVLDITKGFADLSRRALMFEMQGLSFREYLIFFHGIELPPLTLEQVVNNDIKLPNGFHPIPYFRGYLKNGYYPFGVDAGFDIRLQQVVNQTMEVDIPQYAGMNTSTGRKLKKMLVLLSSLAPYKPNFSNLSTELSVSKNDVPEYILYLEKAGMVGQLRDDTGGMRGLGKVEKLFLDNTNLMYALADESPNVGNLRETFFYNQTRVKTPVIASKISDFKIGEFTFEVGGRNKGRSQLREAERGFVVKDDIEFGFRDVIPLWMFGLLY